MHSINILVILKLAEGTVGAQSRSGCWRSDLFRIPKCWLHGQTPTCHDVPRSLHADGGLAVDSSHNALLQQMKAEHQGEEVRLPVPQEWSDRLKISDGASTITTELKQKP